MFALQFADHPSFAQIPNEQVALIALLSDTTVPMPPDEPAPLLALGTVHVAGNPELVQLKTLQAQTLADVLHSVLGQVQRGPAAAILCGDLNSGPGTPIYAAVATHALQMRSALVVMHGAEPRGTFRTNEIEDCVDYVFFSPLLRVVRATDLSAPLTPMPSAEHPSDHLPVWADFEWAL
jgi:endonuclease/exonuclease/phosphatase family metal-dependent hydrolase